MNSRLALKAQEFCREHWQQVLRWREKLQFREEALHLLLAGGVGVIGGLVNLFFFYAIESVKRAVLRRPGDPVEVAEEMAAWQVALIPAVGGLVAGLVLYWGLRLVGRQGAANMLEVVVAGDGKLPFRTNLVKALSSLVSIGTGASIGREGAITQLSATLASKLGQFGKWPPYRLRLLVGCGAASGIAAAYNAPIAGAVFAAWIVLGNFSMNLFAPLVFASVIASMVSRSFFGIKPWYEVPSFGAISMWQLPWFILLGIVAGLLGAVFLKMIRRCEIRFEQNRWPIYTKLALAGLIVGLIAVAFPGVWGNGYVITNRILHEDFDHLAASWVQQGLSGGGWVILFLVGLLLAKMLATAVTVGSGTVGGVFTPTLFLGASLGALFGVVLQTLGGARDMPPSAFALVGMGSILAATTRSPLLAMIMVFEISLDYSLMPPLMLGCVVSILVAGRLHPESIYTEPLRQRGLELGEDSTQPGVITERKVGDLMHAPVPPLRENTPLKEIANRFMTSSNNFLPVVNADQKLLGVVALQDLKEYLHAGEELQAVIAYDVMRPPPRCVTPNQRLLEVLPVVLESELRNIPVVNSFKENRLVGALARGEALGIFAEAIAAGSKPAG
ncbi:MAG: ClcB-like voltage-gated chloride channel protein [Verrucomicrobia bacterium]|nr:ClcB-like voltage-gated chloride channel protein [Verrucomicrobiota bacterium]